MRNLLLLFLLPVAVSSQQVTPTITVFPSLRIPSHSRGLSMGDAGIAGATDNQQLGYNPAKSAFAQNFHQTSVSYLPWLSSISDDSRFMCANYLATIGNSSSIGFAINYLDLGSIAIRDAGGATLGVYKSNDYHIATSYALQLGGNASLGVGLKFLGSRIFTTAVENRYGFCGDVSYYQFINLGDVSKKLEWGAVVSNLGPKINLPANIGLGVSYTSLEEETRNSWQFSLDANKLLADALRAVRFSAGIEYGFADQFFLRSGVSLENKLYGNRKFISFGVGYKGLVNDQSWGVDLYYLVPFGTMAAVSPFQNAFGCSLKVNFGNFQ